MNLWRKPIGKLLVIFVVWRVMLFGIGIVAENVLPYRPDFAYTSYSYYLEKSLSNVEQFLEPWANFDGVHYLNIARRGYVDEMRFFPLLPIFIYGASFGNSQAILLVGFLLSQLLTFFALYYLFKLLRLDYSEKISFRVLVCLLTFPTSFFLGTIYTEGLFLLSSVVALYSARKQQWGIAALAAVLASATRIVGVVLVPVLLIELFIQQHKKIDWKKVCMICAGGLGLLVYSYYLYREFGDPLLFLKGHTTLGNSRSMGLLLPIQTCFRYLKILLILSPSIYEWWVALLEISMFLLSTALLTIGWVMKIRRSYWWFAFFAFIIPAMSGTFTGLPRYILPLFPIFIPIALAKQNWPRYIYFMVTIPLLILFTILFTRGYFIA